MLWALGRDDIQNANERALGSTTQIIYDPSWSGLGADRQSDDGIGGLCLDHSNQGRK